MRPAFKIVATNANGQHWRVVDYQNAGEAERHRKKAQEWADAHELHCRGECDVDNPYDGGYSHSSGPVTYAVKPN